MVNDILKVLPDEPFEDYRYRIYMAKFDGKVNYTWRQIACLFNNTFAVKRDESKWRKEAAEYYKFLQTEVNVPTSEKTNETNTIDDMKELILEYKKERVKLSDERVQNNAYIRRMAREETILEIAKYAADTMSAKKILPVKPLNVDNSIKQEAIIQISDWHYGIEIDNFLNKFNPDICVDRIGQLLHQAKTYLTKNPVRKIYVVNLGDLICGRIHNTLRLQSRFDVITQIIKVSEMLYEFINELSEIAPIEYYDCLDNHSRLEPIKSDSLELETLQRITPWYLKSRFEHNPNVSIMENFVNEDIICFYVMDGRWCVGGVHGHKDKPTKVVDNLTMITKIRFDLILTAHLHHFSSDEKNETMIISNGSMMGTDAYALDLRLSSMPSQNIILINEKTVAEAIHRVILD